MSVGPSIAHITEAFEGGIATYMTLVLPALVKKGYDITLYCCASRHQPHLHNTLEVIRRGGVRVRLLRMCRDIRLLRDMRAGLCLYKAIESTDYDLVHTHGSKAGALGRLAAMAARRPVVHTPHCYAFLRTKSLPIASLTRGLERLVSSATSHLIAVSPSERNAAIQHRLINPRHCYVVPNGLPPLRRQPEQRELARRKWQLPSDAFIVTMPARLVAYKGIHLLLEAAKLCDRDDVVFMIAGHGPLEQSLRKRINYEGLTERVRMLGYVQDVPRLLAASDVCVLCSEAEGQPYVLLEAMREGCPIIAPAVPGIDDFLVDHVTALLVRREGAELAQAIHRIRNDETLRRKLAQRAKDIFIEKHLLERQINGLDSIYRRLCKTHRYKAMQCR